VSINGGGKVKSSGRKSAKIECRRPLPPSGLKGEAVGRDISETLHKNPSKKRKEKENKNNKDIVPPPLYTILTSTMTSPTPANIKQITKGRSRRS
jgi:hypothetical protein